MGKRFSIGSKYEYCPNGNYWQDISGIFDREIYLFCDCVGCGGQVYVLRARKVNTPNERIEEIVRDTRERNKLQDIKDKITTGNMDKVLKAISTPTKKGDK